MHFNSIKVRLEHLFFGLFQFFPVKFQFHKGTIRTIGFAEKAFKNYHFNSIKVRLEQPKHDSDSSIFIFQFHKGTIRTVALDFAPQGYPISIP